MQEKITLEDFVKDGDVEVVNDTMSLDEFSKPVSTPPVVNKITNPKAEGSPTFEYKKEDTLAKKALKTAGNVPGSAYELGKGIVKAGVNAFDIGDFTDEGFKFSTDENTVANLVRLGMGGIDKLVGADTENAKMVAQVGNYFADRYGSKENIAKTVVEDPTGFLFDLSTLLTGGGTAVAKAGKVAEIGSIARAGQSLSKMGEVANPITQGAKVISKVPKIATPIKGALGITTGKGKSLIDEASQSVFASPESRKAFVEGLRGATTEDELVASARQGLNSLKQERTNTYNKNLEAITDTKSYDISPIQNKIDTILKENGVRILDDGSYDFTRAPQLSQFESQVKALEEVIKDWGSQKGDRQIKGIDKLKQTIDNFRIGTADAKGFDRLITQVRNEAKGLGSENAEYQKLLNDYRGQTELIDDITNSLSLKNGGNKETAFKKLISTMKTDNNFRREMLKELETVAGKNLTSKIAGQQMSEFTPQWLKNSLGQSVTTLGGVGAISLGGASILSFLPALALTSPRIIGEILNAMGVAKEYVVPLTKAIKGLAPATTPTTKLDLSKGLKDNLEMKYPEASKVKESLTKELEYDDLPTKIKKIVDTFDEDKDAYREADRIIRELERNGYTADYGLDGVLHSFAKLTTKKE